MTDPRDSDQSLSDMYESIGEHDAAEATRGIDD